MSKRLLENFLSYNTYLIVTVITAIIVAISVPLVYLLLLLFNIPYDQVLFIISIIAPTLIAPPTIIIILKLSRYLQYFKDELKKEIQKTKEMDSLLYEQSRFTLMGEMMANISHQWKQPLNTIGLAVVSARLSSPENLDKNFDIIEDNVRYLSATINDFLSFFDKRMHNELRTLDSIINEIKSIISIHISNKLITFTIDIDKKDRDIQVASSISQVILNLLNNAKDALEEKEKDKKINLYFHTTSKGLSIECIDNAKGINKEIEKKIFEPYFTTKSKTQGTGIGLYMSKQIVENIFNGTIELFNSTQKGSNFLVMLPYSDNCLKHE